MSKRRLADELADLFNPAPAAEADPEALGVNDDAAIAAANDEQLEALQSGSQGTKRAREASRRLRADIDLEDKEYRGRRSSRAAIFGEEEGQEAGNGHANGIDKDEEDEEDEEGEEAFSEDALTAGEDEDEDEAGDEDEEDGDEGPEEQAYGSGDEDDKGTLKKRVAMAMGTSAAASRELAELEQEYGQLQKQEEEAVVALRQRGDKEREKGRAVTNQQHLYDRALELRILLQKALGASMRLPLQPLPAAVVAPTLAGLPAGITALRRAAAGTLGQMMELQQALLARNEAITSQAGPALQEQLLAAERGSAAAANGQDSDSQEEGPSNSQACWERLDLLHQALGPFRDSALDRWHRRTVLMGAGALKGAATQLRALNQSISSQVAAAMRDSAKLIQRSRLPADSCPRPLGEPQAATAAAETAGAEQEDDGENAQEGSRTPTNQRWLEQSYDDGEFYQQLLREFLARAGSTPGSAGQASAGKRRKVVDRRASKGRKIRYHVQEKLVNFMAPVVSEPPAFAAQLFANLFGSSVAAGGR